MWFELASLGPFVVLPTEPLLLVLDIFSLTVYLNFTQRLNIVSLQLNCAGNFMMNEKLNESAFLIIGLIRQIGRLIDDEDEWFIHFTVKLDYN